MTMIAEVLSVVPAASQPEQAVAEPAPAPAPPPEPAAPAMADIAPPPPPSDAPVITVGLTKAQVIAALGQPDTTEKVGLKDIYHYKTMTVTLTSGKVSKVQAVKQIGPRWKTRPDGDDPESQLFKRANRRRAPS